MSINRIATRIRTARRDRMSECAAADPELFMRALQTLQVAQQVAQPMRAPRW